MTHPAEEILENAARSGMFSNLSNNGKPLNLDEYLETPEELRMAFSILENADTPPQEIGLLQEIADLKAQLAAETRPKYRSKIQSQLRDRTLQKDILMERIPLR